MEFALTEEQEALEQTVREWLTDRFDLAQVRDVYNDAAGDGLPPELWKAAADQGWLAVLVPEDHGGLGLKLLDATAVARALGHGVAPGPFIPACLAEVALLRGGSAEQQERLLPALAAGERTAAVALRAESGAWDLSGVDVHADGTRLTGSCGLVEYAHLANVLVVAATGADGPGLYLVDPAAAGVTVTRVDALDRTTRLAEVRLDGAAGERLAASDGATVTALHAYGAVLAAADLVGTARRALDVTVEYLKTREQFGVPIGSFQALKHILADLYTGLVLAEHGVIYAAYAVDTDRDDAELAVSVAKAKASDVAREMTGAAIQLHGGIGFTWEADAHFFFKRAKRLEYAYGDADWHRERIARLYADAPATAAG